QSMNTKIMLTVFTSLIATAVFAFDPPPVGSAAPDFSLADASGKTHSLSQYKGKTVVLEWFNPECPFVKKHYGSGNMQKLQEEYTGKGIVWLLGQIQILVNDCGGVLQPLLFGRVKRACRKSARPIARSASALFEQETSPVSWRNRG